MVGRLSLVEHNDCLSSPLYCQLEGAFKLLKLHNAMEESNSSQHRKQTVDPLHPIYILAYKQEQRQETSILVQKKTLKVVDHFKYLGSQLSNHGRMRDEITQRIQQSSTSFSKLYQRVWEKKHIKLKYKDKELQH